MGTAYTWLCIDAAGRPMSDPALGGGHFPGRADAEGWLGQEWESLAQQGVAAVTLCRGEEVVYGPMSLSPEP